MTQQYDSLDIYPKDSLSYYEDTCSSLFVPALFTIAKKWNQPRCPSVDEWIMKACYINTIGFYSAIKKNKITQFSGKWIGLGNKMGNLGPKGQILHVL